MKLVTFTHNDTQKIGAVEDNLVYDLAARYSGSDNLNRNFTQIQRTFFKLNGLSWWTNSLKDGAMLGMGNYVAKQRKIPFNNLTPEFKRLIIYKINEKSRLLKARILRYLPLNIRDSIIEKKLNNQEQQKLIDKSIEDISSALKN